MLEQEYKYYKNNLKSLLRQYKDKVLVIKDQEIVGIYDTEEEAYKDATSKFKLGTFLIQRCLPEDESALTFSSRAIFS